MVKYKTEGSRYRVTAKIEAVEIIKETEKMVTYVDTWRSFSGEERSRECRAAKVSDTYIYHDTWEAAHAHLVAEAEKHVASARLALERAKGAQGNVKGMKKPE